MADHGNPPPGHTPPPGDIQPPGQSRWSGSVTDLAADRPGSRFDRALQRVPWILSSRPHIIWLIALGIYLIVLPLVGFAVSAEAELIGGNYTNVTSDIGACIAAGGTLHLVNQGRKRQRADAERLTLLRRYTRSCTTCTPPQRPIPGRLPANPARTDGRQSKSSSQHGPTTEASLLAPTNSLSALTARPGRVVGGQVMTRLGQGDPAAPAARKRVGAQQAGDAQWRTCCREHRHSRRRHRPSSLLSL